MKRLAPLAILAMLANVLWERRRRDRTVSTRHLVVIAGLLLVALAVGGFLVMASGVVSIKASAGHWAVTQALLQFAKRRSVATYTVTVDMPPLDDPMLVLKGAGHYEFGCRPCHGSPELRHPRVARAMLPAPPYLGERVGHWKPEELFHIVKHGIKFTGMPAWPAVGRDDEVRAVVAFLLVLPSLDPRAYRRLVFGDERQERAAAPIDDLDGPPEIPAAVIASCARCHGRDGLGRGEGAFPKLAGQRRAYLANALEAFARDERQSGIMQPLAAGLDARQITALADYYARLPAGSGSARASFDPAVARGREIAARGIPERKVPSCADCHGPAAAPRNPAYPALAGQHADYLELQLELFKRGRRGGSRYAHVMRHVADRLGPEEMRAAALYYASLPGDDPAR